MDAAKYLYGSILFQVSRPTALSVVLQFSFETRRAAISRLRSGRDTRCSQPRSQAAHKPHREKLQKAFKAAGCRTCPGWTFHWMHVVSFICPGLPAFDPENNIKSFWDLRAISCKGTFRREFYIEYLVSCSTNNFLLKLYKIQNCT